MSRLGPRLSSNYMELCEGTLSKKYHALNWNSNISRKWCKWWGLWAQRNTLDPNVFYIAFEFTKFFFSFLIPPRWCFLFSSSLIFSLFTLSLSFAFIPRVITQSFHVQTQFLFSIITFSVRFSRSRTKRSFVVLRGYLRFQFYFSIVNFQSVRGLNPGYGHLVSCQVAKWLNTYILTITCLTLPINFFYNKPTLD